MATTDILPRLREVASALRGGSLGISFDAVPARMVLAKVEASRQAASVEGEEDFFDARDAIVEAVNAAWRRSIRPDLALVRSELKDEMTLPLGYVDRCAERLGSDFGSSVESSDWLTAMRAQEDAMARFAILDDLDDTPALREALDGVLHMVEAMDAATPPMDEGEAPFLLPGTVRGLAALIPLIVALHSRSPIPALADGVPKGP